MTQPIDRFPATRNWFHSVEQGSDEWHDLRRGMVTASTIGALITPKTKIVSKAQSGKTKLLEIAAERITQRSEEPFTSRDIERGYFYEPIARDEYAKHYGVEVEEIGFIVRRLKNDHLIGFSPDGKIKDAPRGIEIKSRKQRIQVDTILADAVPDDNIAQLQCGLFVTGWESITYISYSTGMPLYTKTVYPDKRWQKVIPEALEYAEEQIQSFISDYETRAAGMPVTEYVEQVEDWELELGGLSL